MANFGAAKSRMSHSAFVAEFEFKFKFEFEFEFRFDLQFEWAAKQQTKSL